MLTFAKRCAKEILRDPINLGFGLGFPLVLLLLLSALQANLPVSLFEINTLTPGITVFGLSFYILVFFKKAFGKLLVILILVNIHKISHFFYFIVGTRNNVGNDKFTF